MSDQKRIPTLAANQNYHLNLKRRHRFSAIWRRVFRLSTFIGMLVLLLLLISVTDSTFGYTVYEYKVDPASLVEGDTTLDSMPKEQLLIVLQENLNANAYKTIQRDNDIESMSAGEVYDLVVERILKPTILTQWGFYDSLLHKTRIESEAADAYPEGTLKFTSWLSQRFLERPQSSDALRAGVSIAIQGSLWTIGIAFLFAFPVGVGAAIYLEEYASKNLLNRIIQTNINNLAGVPSIIYGMLGLAIFVRALEYFTSGAFLGTVDPTTANGRTIISAGLTLGLLILPLIIINSQEAIKAVPNSLRQASFGLGATRWQTVWSHVLPNAVPGILTGTILSISRAIGETAPLVVVGASTFITQNPDGPFSKFTTLPIQIWQWTTRPQDVFRNVAGAAIIVLLILLLTLNASAVILRNRSKRRL